MNLDDYRLKVEYTTSKTGDTVFCGLFRDLEHFNALIRYLEPTEDIPASKIKRSYYVYVGNKKGPMTKEEFIETGGLRCPFCRSEATSMTSNLRYACDGAELPHDDRYCNDCGEKWIVWYTPAWYVRKGQ